MTAKLIIVQNELKDRRGHYLETAAAVAEAAPRHGLTPYVLGHATCDPRILPTGVAFLPVCRLDHQMHFPPVPSLPLGPYRVTPQPDPPPPPVPSRRLVTLVKPLVPPLVAHAAKRLLRAKEADTSPPDVLDQAGCSHERHFISEWGKDLAFALTLLQVDANDHVLFLTAHARELHAVRRIVDCLPAEKCPLFHLEFRHSLNFRKSDGQPLNSFTTTHLALYDMYRAFGPHHRIRLYTDTDELAEVYSRASQLAHFTLPIPFRNDKLAPHTRRTDQPVRVTYVGDPRDEKGFHLLPDLITALDGEPVRFVIQASLADVANNPLSATALTRLRECGRPNVELIGLDGPLNADTYFALVSAADLIVFPFDREAYSRRSSGTLTEAIAAGVPTVVPADTWLARQQPAGSGERFDVRNPLVDAVRRVLRNREQYERRAAEARGEWLNKHTPDNLIRALTSSG